MDPSTVTAISAVSAFFSAVATALAALATWRTPQTTARLAEQLRRDAERTDEKRRYKLSVFVALMQARGQIASDDSVRALNQIDVAFNESREVREAWSELYHGLSIRPYPVNIVDERVRRLLSAMARDLGIADALRNDDLSRFYFPEVQVKEQLVKDMQRDQLLKSLQSGSAANATAPGLSDGLWPPKPDSNT